MVRVAENFQDAAGKWTGRVFVPDQAPARAITQCEQVDDWAIDKILQAVRKHLGTEIALVTRYVEDHQLEITHVDTELEVPFTPGFREPREESYCWHVLHGRLPQLICDPEDFAFTESFDITNSLPVGCHLNVPLRLSDGSVYGSFCCLSRNPDRSMTERDLNVLKAFAALATIQIERSLVANEQDETARNAIREILDKKLIQIVHQPILHLASGVPAGVECLSRFPDADLRGPDKWFAQATQIGLGTQLELLAIEQALETLPHLPNHSRLGLNVSPETVMSGELGDILAPYQNNTLVLELTEHQRVSDFDALKSELAKLKPFAKLAIDDVGTGYSGMRHLVELEPDVLKLDMSLTRDIHKDLARQALTAAMMHFAKEIGAKLVAEGIECEEERAKLENLGVDYGQGYLFAMPMPAVASAQYMMRKMTTE